MTTTKPEVASDSMLDDIESGLDHLERDVAETKVELQKLIAGQLVPAPTVLKMSMIILLAVNLLVSSWLFLERLVPAS